VRWSRYLLVIITLVNPIISSMTSGMFNTTLFWLSLIIFTFLNSLMFFDLFVILPNKKKWFSNFSWRGDISILSDE
jgi:archaellum biogenesis protein FlaJ (TadC family)